MSLPITSLLSHLSKADKNTAERLLREVGRRFYSGTSGTTFRAVKDLRPKSCSTSTTASTPAAATQTVARASRTKLPSVETIAARESARRQKLLLATLGLVVGHGISIYGYLKVERVPLPGTEIEVNLAPLLGFAAYMAVTRARGGVVFYILGQGMLTCATLGTSVMYMSNWVEERTPALGQNDIPDLLQLLNDLRAQTPPPARLDLTSGHITQTTGADAAIIVALRTFYASFFGEGTEGLTKARFAKFLEGDIDLEKELQLPGGINITKHSLIDSHVHMLDAVFRFMDYDGDGTVGFREFALAALMFWAARDGNTQAQQVVMFKLMDADMNGKITKEELEPWVELLHSHGSIPKEDLTVRAWHLLYFRDVTPKELAKRYIKEFDTDRDGAINLAEFARMSAKFTFSNVFEAMIERKH